MVVLAASICTRGGKALISRQFRELSRDRLTALLAAFPALLSDTTANQHTTVEGDGVRYVYQPLEEFYAVLITPKGSNILQDIDTLHLFTQTVTSILRVVDEREIFDNCFEILSAFDEIVSFGYRENVSLNQIKTFLEMDSHEEKIQEIIEKNKELEAAEERKRRTKEIQRKEMAKRTGESFGYDNYQQQAAPVYSAPPVTEPSYQEVPSARRTGGGLQLGKKAGSGASHQPLLVSQPHQQNRVQPPAPKQEVAAPQKPKPENNGILVGVNEQISAQFNRDGSIVSSELKGDLQLSINDPSLALCVLQLDTKDSHAQFKTHPNVDKSLFNSDHKIGLKDPSKPFPSNNQSLGVLRWRAVGQTDDSSLVPLLFSTWVNDNGDGSMNVTFEYELTQLFQSESHSINQISIHIPTSQSVELTSCDNDNVQKKYNEEGGVLLSVSKVADQFPQGSFELSIDGQDEEDLFPMSVLFDVENNLSNLSSIKLKAVNSLQEEEELPYDLYYNLVSSNYSII